MSAGPDAGQERRDLESAVAEAYAALGRARESAARLARAAGLPDWRREAAGLVEMRLDTIARQVAVCLGPLGTTRDEEEAVRRRAQAHPAPKARQVQ